MKADVKIKICSTVEELNEKGLVESSDRTDATHSADLATRDGIVRIEYTEKTESGDLKTVLTARDERVTLIRHGAIESEFLFEVGLTHKSIYRMPPYAFDTEVRAVKITNDLNKRGTLSLLYYMTLGGAEKRIKMTLSVIE